MAENASSANPDVTYESLRERFHWPELDGFNMGSACADRHPETAIALVSVDAAGSREYSFGQLSEWSNRLANGLRAHGVSPGDRVGIQLPQSIETGIAHIAIYKLGAVAVPLSVQFGPQALLHRLGDSGARVVITDEAHLGEMALVARDLTDLRIVLASASPSPGFASFWGLIEDGSPRLTAAPTSLSSPALLIYTSGTTGAPKGALHGHRVLLGHLPGFELSHDFFPQPGDRMWTPADWAWIGGLLDALLPSWYHGQTVLAAPRARFDPEWAVWLMATHHVRNAFLPPTALKLARQARIDGQQLSLRSVMCGGEPLGEEILTWARTTLGVTVNEIYGQTEANYVVGNSRQVWPIRPGSMGRPYPGHDVTIRTAEGAEAGPEEPGEICVRAGDPVIFLEYLNQPIATRAKFSADGGWLRTGDIARRDSDGYIWFESRTDDVITSSGYRIGPGEIEECLVRHPAVALAAAVGVPDELRGHVVKAFVQLAAGSTASPQLAEEIRQLVRTQLAPFECPREIEFIDEMPLTTTGKIRRVDLRDRAASIEQSSAEEDD